MAYRAVPSQADLDPAQNTFTVDVNTFLDFDADSIFNRPTFAEPWPQEPSPLNANPFGLNHQQYPNHQLPSLPDLFTERQFSDHFDPFQQQVNSFTSHYRHHNPLSPATNYSRSQQRPSWTTARLDSALPSLDSASRRSTSDTFVQHRSAAPPRAEQPRQPSAAVQSTHTQLLQPNWAALEPNGDDYYLAALANDDFSSPSLPPINSSPLPPSRPQSSNLPKPLEVGEAMPIVDSHNRRTSKGRLVDLTKEEPDFDSTSGIDPTTPAMPSTRKRTAAASNGETQPAASKRRRTSRSSPSSSGRFNKSRSKQTTNNDRASSPFADDEPFDDPNNADAHETIDLSNAAEVPKELMAPGVDNRVKIGNFQCVICMDDASHLTVTHCGHLFCSECLHSALHIDNMKKTCPVCRTKVDPKEKKGKNQKSYYHLELKIMTANKKGKRPAGAS
ncbi:hypothetical protein F5Y06DRAFT_194530 [Hypoxylon sp. FL0890]|nr:hypothetical protein F5Y06DRAFT_194530 [Hypoxylon sp. FL0890]